LTDQTVRPHSGEQLPPASNSESATVLGEPATKVNWLKEILFVLGAIGLFLLNSMACLWTVNAILAWAAGTNVVEPHELAQLDACVKQQLLIYNSPGTAITEANVEDAERRCELIPREAEAERKRRLQREALGEAPAASAVIQSNRTGGQ
jgi:hypothetical protein